MTDFQTNVQASASGSNSNPGRLIALFEGLLVVATIASLLVVFRHYPLGKLLGDFAGETALVIGFLLATVFLWARGERWQDLGLSWPVNWRSLKGQAGLAIIAVYAAVILVPLVVVPLFGIEAPTLERHDPVIGNFSVYLVRLVVVSWGSAAFLEEMVARAFLINRFGKAFGDTRYAVIGAVLLQGFFFGLAHPGQGVAGMMQTGAIGVVLGTLYIRYQRNLWPLVVAHGVIDSISFTMIYFNVMP